MVKLPLECEVEYHAGFLTSEESASLFAWILDNCAQHLNDAVCLADGTVHRTGVGKLMFVDRKLIDYSLLAESFGNRLEWPPVVAAIRDRVQDLTGIEFAVCVCLHYADGGAGVGFHADLPAFGPVTVLPSVSLGQPREFALRKQSDPNDQFKLTLEDGSLLVMGEGCQALYEHALPVNPDCKHSRINLTFRVFDGLSQASPTRGTI